MRSIPSDIASKLTMLKQTRANSADPSASIWIGRPTTPLTTDVFLEKQAVLTGASITDTSVAVCHPRQGAANTKINIGYIDGGVAKVVTAAVKTKMSNHIWIDSGFSENASAISVAYDGTMPKDDLGNVEFVTESQPWVFWVYNGAMCARKLGSPTTVTLAESNCTDVSAIRAMWSEVGGFDFGLIVFFLLNGTIYYRQLIDGEWTDAETVTFGPSGVTWTSIAAFRTWDYRVGVQGKTSTGDLYELFTQFMGIGKQTIEHVEVKTISADGTLTGISYTDTKADDQHIALSNAVALGLRQWFLPVYGVAAENIADENDDWGKFIVITLDHPCNLVSVPGNGSQFSITDQNNMAFYSSSISVSEDGMQLTIGFIDFNSANGEVLLAYTPGSISSPPVNPEVAMQAWSLSFTPTNLVPPEVDPPEPLEVWNE